MCWKKFCKQENAVGEEAGGFLNFQLIYLDCMLEKALRAEIYDIACC